MRSAVRCAGVLAVAWAACTPLLAATAAGTVTSSGSTPVQGVGVRWADVATGTVFSGSTNLNGQYFIAVPLATYDVEFIPPAGGRLVAVRRTGIVVAATTVILDAVLPDGSVLSGRVVLEGGAAAAGVDLDLLDAATGVKAFVPNDQTDLAGQYRLVALPGFYDVRFRPPLATLLVPAEIESVDLTLDRALADLTLRAGIVVSGEVIDSLGAPLEGADFDFVDHATGRARYTIRDNSDADGLFSVVVPAGLHDIILRPPSTHPRLASIRIPDQVLTADTSLPRIEMAEGVVVSGRVRDAGGSPLAGAAISFVDDAAGREVPVRGALTDGSGAFAVAVPPGVYRVQLAPPAGTRLAGAEIGPVPATSDLSLPDVGLTSGHLLSASVTDAGGSPLRHADLDVFDAITGARVYTPHDDTDYRGAATVALPAGTYNVVYRPPREADLLPLRRAALSVDADLLLPAAALPPGSRLTGRVVGPTGAGAPRVDLDVLDPITGSAVLTVRDETDFRGVYSLVVPDGVWDLVFEPARGDRLLPGRLPGVTVAGPTDAGTVTLAEGVLLSGRVLDPSGAAAPRVDIDVNDPLTRLPLQIANDVTDAAGTFDVAVPPGTYDLDFEPPPSSRLVPVRMPGVAVPADTRLPDVRLRSGFLLSGQVLDPRGAPVEGLDLDVFDAISGAAAFAPNAESGADGRFQIVLDSGTYNANLRPPAGARLLPARLTGLVLAADLDLGSLTLQEGVLVSGQVLDSSGSPVEGVDLDFLDVATGRVAFTVRDTTDASGGYQVAVPAATYDVEFEPPAGLPLAARVVRDVQVLADTVLAPVVLSRGFTVTGTVLDPAGAPVAGAEPHFFDALTGFPVLTLRDSTDAAGVFRALLPAGRYAGTVNPPPGTPFGAGAIPEFGVSGDGVLPAVRLPSGGPAVFSVTPLAGPTTGGTLVEVRGQNFQPGTLFTLGGRSADTVSLEGSTLAIIRTRSHPEALLALEARNPDGTRALLPGAFRYVSTGTPIVLSLSLSGGSVVLSWGSTGQPSYTIFRSADPRRFGDAEVIGTTSTPGFTDGSAPAGARVLFYQVE